MGTSPTLQAYFEEASDDLYAWAAARMARDPTLEVVPLLQEMATYGLGELAKEAQTCWRVRGTRKQGRHA